jgi:hypothetical protein
MTSCQANTGQGRGWRKPEETVSTSNPNSSLCTTYQIINSRRSNRTANHSTISLIDGKSSRDGEESSEDTAQDGELHVEDPWDLNKEPILDRADEKCEGVVEEGRHRGVRTPRW